jgi:hypothetical protein
MNIIAANDNHLSYDFSANHDDSDVVVPIKRKNGNRTFTKEGREKAAAKIRERRSGWPEHKKGTFEKKMTELGRRFDKPGMEVTFKKVSVLYSLVLWLNLETEQV